MASDTSLDSIRAELDTLYSPSCWSKKLSKNIIVENHIKVITEASEMTKTQTRYKLNIPYGEVNSGETFDIYHPSQDCPERSALLVFIHGGYWSFLEKEHYGFVALPLVKQGITVAVINFANAPKGTMTTIVDQCRRACLHIARTFSDKRLYLCGHSAGSHLCACVLSTPWSALGLGQLTVHGALLGSGIYDLDPIQRCCVNDPLNLTQTEVMDYSPQHHAQKFKENLSTDFCCLLFYGEQESPEFKRQSQEYHQALTSVGVVCTVCEVEDEDHFTVVERMVEQDYSVTQRLVELLIRE